ncbi:hypothetical protein B0H14DRAFT_3491653 [Mycena olivaceomarginata]|nr:hypothetical protein B0H14DRAFT_3491653 [Mycena olivaceomarginata]
MASTNEAAAASAAAAAAEVAAAELKTAAAAEKAAANKTALTDTRAKAPAPVDEAAATDARAKAKAPVDEAPMDEAPAKAPVDEAPMDQAPVNEAPVDEAAATEARAKAKAPVDEAPMDKALVDEATDAGAKAKAPVDEAPMDEAPVNEAPVDEAAAADARAKAKAPVDEVPMDEAPVDKARVDKAPMDEAAGTEARVKAKAPMDEAVANGVAATDARAKAATGKAAKGKAATGKAAVAKAAAAKGKAVVDKVATNGAAATDARGKAAMGKAEVDKAAATDARAKAPVDDAAAAADENSKKSGKKRKKYAGSDGEDAVERSLQEIDEEPSDLEEGSVPKKPLVENEALWRQIEEAVLLMKTKDDAEKALAKLAKDNKTTEKKVIIGAREKKSSDPPKGIEDKWVFSFQPEAEPFSGEDYFSLMTPEDWREKIEEDIWKELLTFNKTAPEEGYSMSVSNRRLLRKVAELLPACATMLRRTTKHILSDIDDFTHCRFHDQKRTTVQAKQVDGWTSSKFAVDGVALVALEKSKEKKPKKKGDKSNGPSGRAPMRQGFLDCGCDKDAALFDFMWFKTWKVKSTNPNFLVEEGMKNDVFSARHRAFFTQGYSSGTCLQIEDFFSTNPAWGTPEYEIRLRSIQVERIMTQLNALKELGPKKGSVTVEMPGDDERMEGVES